MARRSCEPDDLGFVVMLEEVPEKALFRREKLVPSAWELRKKWRCHCEIPFYLRRANGYLPIVASLTPFAKALRRHFSQ